MTRRNAYRYQASPSLSDTNLEKGVGVCTMGPTLNCHYTYLETSYYYAAVDICVALEGPPVLKVLWLVSRQRHLSDVSNHVLV